MQMSQHTEMITADPRSVVDLDVGKPARWGVWLVLAGFGGFLLWSWLAPLDAGVVATGTVKVTSNRKAVQHLSGGTVEAILVREGDLVTKGQEVVRLDSLRAAAEQGAVSAQYIVSKTVENRLEAERDNRDVVNFDPELLKRFKDDHRLEAAMDLQQRLLDTRRAGLAGEISILQENLAASAVQLKGLQQVYSARASQISFLNQELQGTRVLTAEGYVPRNRLLELERSNADLAAGQAENLNNIARVRSQTTEIKLRILQRQHDYLKEVESQLTETAKENTTLADRLRALDYEVTHTVIRSPIDGMVQALSIATVGGIIQPGFKIMEIVPVNEPLQVDAMIPVQAIDKMFPGLPVDISFPAFNHAQTPNIPGRVMTISADRLMDEESKQPFYLAQVEVTPDGMSLLGTNHIRPGMPASVTIKTGERNMLSYLLKPMLERVDSSFKEQ
ncbi:Type I secretion system membrane fusion protein PrsE [Pseudomonas fluorescens]|jgi:protease secretion system membrane fusion protein|uniref:Membrane fusion protein (MFP) family protein n=1 Tax=Pseudomonas fluorescens TaxID=294 RepID=A0A5E7H2R0_PSEFL|nr:MULTISPECIES: HlyD family type I secretion periplasmic adaptor subunit [Pseudomonas]MBV7527055.1 HlyD family type I secretion periplasmic adaptor subunit [Pseudomonas sp. PDM29]OOQ44056.1 HlyD family type I secretion periplasmic adaptor subunit [Pseudomonas fluorescens]VVM59231.1 Type I secretion system membrane fusion protein PrsE [Pseudomonas fluorescens]VVM64703.1 Type I secretion system membrane fusion protein PrsE [Pseudomonas fluorescens]VVO58190.1 Type I secretion system membrane fus